MGQLLGPPPCSNLSLRITVPTSVLPFTPLRDRVPFPNLQCPAIACLSSFSLPGCTSHVCFVSPEPHPCLAHGSPEGHVCWANRMEALCGDFTRSGTENI